jgi:flagellar basal-body rod protein FlgB
MLEAMFETSSYVTSKTLLDVTAARHQAIAGNLANVHTPGYKRVDVSESFMEKLQSAIGEQDISGMRRLSAPEVSEVQGLEAKDASGNNVNLEKEMMVLAENSFAYEMNAQLVSGSLRRLETAISGRVS